MNGYLQRLIERNQRMAPEIHSTAKLSYAELPMFRQNGTLLGQEFASSTETPAGSSVTNLYRKNEYLSAEDRAETDSGRVESQFNEPGTHPQEHQSPSLVEQQYEASFRPESNQQDKKSQIEQQRVGQSKNELPAQETNQFNEAIFIPLVKIAPQQDTYAAPRRWNNSEDPQPARVIKPLHMVKKDQSKIHFDTFESNSKPNEVHVTIGRIEITAVHAPSAVKPASRPEKKTMSLDEYLAKRNGRSQ